MKRPPAAIKRANLNIFEQLLGDPMNQDAATILEYTLVWCREGAIIEREGGRAHRNDARGNLAQEVAVVGHRDDCAGEGDERLFQHLLGGDVQVVGGLVQHQQRPRGQHEFRQRQPCLFTPAEHPHLRGRAAVTEQSVIQCQLPVVGRISYVSERHRGRFQHWARLQVAWKEKFVVALPMRVDRPVTGSSHASTRGP